MQLDSSVDQSGRETVMWQTDSIIRRSLPRETVLGKTSRRVLVDCWGGVGNRMFAKRRSPRTRLVRPAYDLFPARYRCMSESAITGKATFAAGFSLER